MPATTIITLRCDAYDRDEGTCTESVQTTAVLQGKYLSKARITVVAPEGWWVGHGRYDSDKDIQCGCPKHAQKMEDNGLDW